jgi:hypothetical protein
MAIDLTGIVNENEFYTNHYLGAILEKDLKEVLKKWSDEAQLTGTRMPHAQLDALRSDYFRMRSQIQRERTVQTKVTEQREFSAKLLEVLGYPYAPLCKSLDDGSELPLLAELKRADGAPELWVLEAIDPGTDEQDPLTLSLLPEQFPEGSEIAKSLLETTLEVLISRQVFGRAEPPRWVVLQSGSQLLLLDRGKWNQKRLLRFDLSEILGRRESSTLQATTALVHRDSVAPEEGLCLLDQLDENSHKHAHAVSEDLKYALRRAIELLGNEAIYYRRTIRKKGLFSGKDELDEDQLTLECLRYMYRLLFLFYIEARPELGYVPIKAESYRKGYSLETLRDLELIQLSTEKSKNGTYLHDSLQMLFTLVYDGYEPHEAKTQSSLALGEDHLHNTFSLTSLHTHLFDPKRTPILKEVKLRNCVVQEIINLLSLSRSGGKNKRRGRISYAQLGINQLGAVYEALLSFSGFFAKTDLYEVKKADESENDLETGYFVPEDELEKYNENERVFDEDGKPKKYEKGSFIYRLAGRNRQTSASYYTPESLTQCLVKYALKELLGEKPDDENWKTADEILQLTICEPAMGSAAFLNEAINQMADAYLERKQDELGIKLNLAAPTKAQLEASKNDAYRQVEDYATIRQRVKMAIADDNVYGVDLNPVAVELAEVSLWLNTISPGGFVPWFGNQLLCGNSLVGARRDVFDSVLLLAPRGKKAGAGPWLSAVPDRIEPGAKREVGQIYHFLLPDSGMSVYKDKVVKGLAKEEIAAIEKWRKGFAVPFSKGEVKTLEKLSAAIDRLWVGHTEQQAQIRERTNDPLHVWGQPALSKSLPSTSLEEKDKILQQEMYSENVRSSSAYRRLKLVMDYWCALWFWPMEKAALLPSREEYLDELSLLLDGNVLDVVAGQDEQIPLFSDTQPETEARAMIDEFGLVNVDNLCGQIERLGLVKKLAAERYRFLHWELEFADLFQERGGFDLVVGNPPWIKVVWEEAGVIGDADPVFVLRKLPASKTAELREATLKARDLRGDYLSAYETASGMQGFLNAKQNFSLLEGMKANLYKCFLPVAWSIGSEAGVSGFLHPEGVYDDSKGGALRREVYGRLRGHYQFRNELTLFVGTNDHGRLTFSINIYGKPLDQPRLVHMANVFSPATVALSHQHDGRGPVPGIKDENNNWDLRGHRDRVIEVGKKELALFAKLYDVDGTPALQARLPALHSKQLLGVLEKFAAQPRRLSDLEGDYCSTFMFDETQAQQKRTTRRETRFVKDAAEWILSGPHFYVGTPFYKTPRAVCTQNSHYAVLDLTTLPNDYLPRTNYVPGCSPSEYLKRTPKVPWDGRPVTDFYRYANREMIGPAGERTMISTIIPPGAGHINTVLAYVFRSYGVMLDFWAYSISVPIDYRVKSTGMGHANTSLVGQLPVMNVKSPFRQGMRSRALRLACTTLSYGPLWQELYGPELRSESWAKVDTRLANSGFSSLGNGWSRTSGLRTDYERRQALVEIDVLVSMALDLTLEELQTIYRVQFPVMRQYESDTYYDQKGRIVFTASKGLVGVGFPRKGNTKTKVPGWEDIADLKTGTVDRTIIDDTLPGGPRERTITYHAPFDRCDRETDYATAWAEFTRRFDKKGNA